MSFNQLKGNVNRPVKAVTPYNKDKDQSATGHLNTWSAAILHG